MRGNINKGMEERMERKEILDSKLGDNKLASKSK
jgi:hypothetical protein